MKRIPINKIRGAFPYTVEELADLFGVSLSTVRSLLKKYPQATTGGSPQFVVGRVLKQAFQGSNQDALPLAKFMCTSCKQRVEPAEGLVEVQPLVQGKTARLDAICNKCESAISKFISLKKRNEFEEELGEPVSGEWGD